MDVNQIKIAVRVRPWHPRELPLLSGLGSEPVFLGDGNFAASPHKASAQGALREVVDIIDNRQLNFDKKPDAKAAAKAGVPGAPRYKDRRYVFDEVLNQEATQSMVFEKTAKPLLSGVLDGYNATVFAYGATGCGKTHTISGRPGEEGVIIRSMEYLYNKFEEDKDSYDYHIEVSFVEIYNETIVDLLTDETAVRPAGGLKLMENEKNRVSIAAVTLKRPKSVEEVMDLVLKGNERRATSFTHSNSQSSRSHAVLQVNIGRVSRGTQVDFAAQVVRQCVTSATLSIIDLAGSERAAATLNNGVRMKEGAKINQSLLSLSSCITALCQRPVRGQTTHVPYRNSKLTRLLKFSLGGNCRTVMIVCISPSSKDIEDTHNTLVWANRAKDVSTKISKNTQGVAVRLQQYLERIATQERRIEELEAERIAGPKFTESAAVLARRERDRQEVRQALDGLDAEVEAGQAVINEGAEKRALWDVSQLTVTALLQRIQDLQTEINVRGAALIERDVRYLRSRIDDEQSKYQKNTLVHKIVQREVSRTKTIEKHVENVSSRTFDDLPEVDAERFKLALDYKRKEVDIQVYAAREKGYRAMHRHHANMQAITHQHINSVKEAMESMADAMMAAGGSAAGFVSQLRNEIARSETVLSTVHGDLAPITDALPPPVSFKDVEAFNLPPTPAPQRSRPSLGFPTVRPDILSPSKPPAAPMRFLQPSPVAPLALPLPSLALPEGPTFNLAPVNKNLTRLRGPLGFSASSPRKLHGSPAKSRLRQQIAKRSAMKQPTTTDHVRAGPSKTMRFKGDDSLREEKTMSSVQTGSSSESSPGNDSSSSDWDEVPEEEPEVVKVTNAHPPKPRSGLGPPTRRPVALGALPTGPAAPLASRLSLAPVTAAPVTNGNANDWRAARLRAGQNPFNLNTVSESEENGPSSPSTAASSSRIGGLGLPNRPAKSSPLAESRINPPALPVPAVSRLHMPTAASAAKANGGDVSIALSVTRDPSRRESSTHQSRNRRISSANLYGRPSAAFKPAAADTSDPLLATHLKPTLGVPVRRASMMPSSASMNLGNGSLSMSSQTNTNATGGPAGARASISASSSLAGARGGFGLKSRASGAEFGSRMAGEAGMGLSSRPSISNLRAPVGGKAQWK